MEEPEKEIPFHFESRDYQQPFIRAVNDAIEGRSKVRYFYQIWHRRSGKDKVDIADCIPRSLIHSPGLVKMVYPTLVMGRENLWDGIGKDGFAYKDHIPEDLRIGKANESLMKIRVRTLQNEQSIFQVGGSDHPDSLRGGNPRMMVFSEWAEQDPYALDVIEPIIKENDGIVIFNTTPKGNNHARSLLEYAKNNPLWYVDTLNATETGIWSEEQLEAIREDIIRRFAADGRSEAEAIAYFLQEYMCSFDSPVIGSYYGAAIRRAEREHRITEVPWVEDLPVHTFWDLGMDDSMSIWFMQRVGPQFRFIDYYENSGEGMPFYAKHLQSKPYVYGRHYPPHDIKVREINDGQSRFNAAKKLGIKFEMPQSLSLEDGIDACRRIFRQCWFDTKNAYRGINCLKSYTKDWDPINKVFKLKPKHNWASHGADAFRTFGVGYKDAIPPSTPSGYGGVKPYMPGIG